MSYASTAEVARVAEVNVATVVRAAQALGFSGWPAMRKDLRSRYLSTLSAAEVLVEHPADGESVTDTSLRADALALHDLMQVVDSGQVARLAAAINNAGRVVVLASGSFAGPGQQFAHLLQILGHDARLMNAGLTTIFNAVSLLGPHDLVLAISLWRTPREVVDALDLARRNGVTTAMLSDRSRPVVGPEADEVIVIPSEGSSMFPSLVGATAVVQALVAEVIAIDEPSAAAASNRIDQAWRDYGVFPPQ